jgi:hypothetical protein
MQGRRRGKARFRDHGTSWSDDQRAREWFYTSLEAYFVRHYEMWVDDPEEGEICDPRFNGTYRKILAAIAKLDYYALISPVFTDEEVLRAESRLRGEYGARQAEEIIAELQQRRRG